MDGLKQKAGEKIGALHDAAKTTVDNSKSKVQDVYVQTSDSIRKIRQIFEEIWHHDLIVEWRARASVWLAEARQRVREGAMPSPALLYKELVAVFNNRVWRRGMLIFICGVALGSGCGLALGLRIGTRAPEGPHARALHTLPDQTVILVEDAVCAGASAGEVLVRVQAFSVCAADRWVLRGQGAVLRSLTTKGPVTVGRAFAGVVLDVGAGVSDLELGDEVWGCVSEWGGGAAELLTVRSTRVSKRPRSLAADSAASLPWGGALALKALERLRYTPELCKEKRVAICGAASGEGCALVQLLSGWGARLTVTAPRHAAMVLQDLGAAEFVDIEGASDPVSVTWAALERHATRAGPWDAVVVCAGAAVPQGTPNNYNALLKSTAPRNAILDLRPRPFISDRLPAPVTMLFAISFYTYRSVRWLFGRGWHLDWLESSHHLRPSLDTLTQLVDSGHLAPTLDKVFVPQNYESALAHACSDDAIGATVIRFP